jgi:hypothetical protein
VTHGVFAYSKDPQAAKDFLRWLMDPKQYRPWIASGDMYFAPYLHAFDKVPEWDIEPRVKPFQKVLETGKLTSWPAPASQQPGGGSHQPLIMIVMFTKAITGTPPRPPSPKPCQIKATTGRHWQDPRGLAGRWQRRPPAFRLSRLGHSWARVRVQLARAHAAPAVLLLFWAIRSSTACT